MGRNIWRCRKENAVLRDFCGTKMRFLEHANPCEYYGKLCMLLISLAAFSVFT